MSLSLSGCAWSQQFYQPPTTPPKNGYKNVVICEPHANQPLENWTKFRSEKDVIMGSVVWLPTWITWLKRRGWGGVFNFLSLITGFGWASGSMVLLFIKGTERILNHPLGTGSGVNYLRTNWARMEGRIFWSFWVSVQIKNHFFGQKEIHLSGS